MNASSDAKPEPCRCDAQRRVAELEREKRQLEEKRKLLSEMLESQKTTMRRLEGAVKRSTGHLTSLLAEIAA